VLAGKEEDELKAGEGWFIDEIYFDEDLRAQTSPDVVEQNAE
jgi:hypothetical protein